MPLRIAQEDITRIPVDAIVNAANQHLLQGGGVCGAIFAAAGSTELQAACDKIGHCDTGSAVATPAFRLPAKHVIHTVGPIWRGGDHGEKEALKSCYRSSLELAYELGDTSIAFPLISSGIYGYPKDEAIDVALSQIDAFLQHHDMDVTLVIFDPASLRAANGRFAHIARYLHGHYAGPSAYREQRDEGRLWSSRESDAYEDYASTPEPFAGSARMPQAPAATPSPSMPAVRPQDPAAPSPSMPASMPPSPKPPKARTSRTDRQHGLLKRLIQHLDASFATTLLRMIDERGLKDSQVYKRANMSRQHFSKIRTKRGYQPKKQTVLALAVALELSLDETRLLLERAGYALTHADERDVIVEYFIDLGEYDINQINLALYAFDQPLLG